MISSNIATNIVTLILKSDWSLKYKLEVLDRLRLEWREVLE